MTKPQWSTEWPTEEGYYWFYGWCFGDRNRSAKLHYVEGHKIMNGVLYITNGHALYQAEGATGLWQPVRLPELPEGDE